MRKYGINKTGCKTKQGLKIAVALVILALIIGGGSYVYAKYFSASARWGVAIASGVYLSSNYAIDNEDFFESVVRSDYVGSNYEFPFEVRNYENNLLFNESSVTISYSVSFWLGEAPVGASYVVEWQNQVYPIGVGEEQRITLTEQSIAGGSAFANKYMIKIIANSEQPHVAVPIYAEVKTDEGAIINKTLRGKMVLNNVAAPESYIESQGFIIPNEIVDDDAKFERMKDFSEFIYEIRTVGEVIAAEVTEELKLSWNPNLLEIDLFDENYVQWKKKTGKTVPDIDDNGWYYITLEVMPYSAQTVYFLQGKDFHKSVNDIISMNNAILAEKYTADSEGTE